MAAVHASAGIDGFFPAVIPDPLEHKIYFWRGERIVFGKRGIMGLSDRREGPWRKCE